MQTIQTEKVTMISTVPAILKDLLTHPRFDDFRPVVYLGEWPPPGQPLPPASPNSCATNSASRNRSSGYGMTETASVCATMSGPVFDLKTHGRRHRFHRSSTFASSTPQGNPLPSEQDGEIQLRGVTVTPGYWHRDDLTQEAFTPDGWLRTGDLGNIDDDGFLHITGRIKEIVIRGGEKHLPHRDRKTSPTGTPSVKEVAVFGVTDDAMGEELAMVCHPQPGSELTEDELRQHLLNVLPTFKVPKYLALDR